MRPPQVRAFFDDELVIDLFAGGGGASCGIEAALGRHVDIAINHDPIAMAVHQANHPHTKHLVSNVWEVDPVVACAGRRVGLLWASPDCFPAGTLVLTREGYRPIEGIRVGEEVLTHAGRWRRVLDTMSTERQLLRVRGHGHPGLTVSGEHPFLARQRTNVWNKVRHGYDRKLGPQAWVPAKQLDRGWYWATPTAFPAAVPPPVPVYGGREISISREFMWLVGRYLADGWTRYTDSRAEIVITCGMHEIDGLRQALSVWPRDGARCTSDEMTWHERETETAYQFTTNYRGLVEWLREHFGHLADGKRIPGWALGMDADLRQALLEGYTSGDGGLPAADGTPIMEATTVSGALAYGVKALAESLGKTVAVYLGENSDEIQGRKVNALPIYSVRWRVNIDEKHRQTFREDGMEWAAIRKREDLGESATVYNLSVEEDESYVVEGIVVHNCTHHSRAKGSKPLSSKRRALASVVVRWARTVRPRVIAMENVAEFADWGPLDNTGRPDKSKTGRSFKCWLGKIRSQGYRIEYKMLVAADYGTPTTRKRLFLIARLDGEPIVWPEPSHGVGRANPWRAAAECLDLADAGVSIFGRKKPLADATMRRIAAGIERYVIKAQPFIFPVTHHGGPRVHGIEDPVVTVTAVHRGELAICTPVLVNTAHGEANAKDSRPRWGRGHRGVTEPLGTVCAGGTDFALCMPVLLKVSRDVQRGAVAMCQAPTEVCAAGGAVDGARCCCAVCHREFVSTRHRRCPACLSDGLGPMLCQPFIVGTGGPSFAGKPCGVDRPVGTILQENHRALIQPIIVPVKSWGGGGNDARSAADPMRTITASKRGEFAICAPVIVKYHGGALSHQCERSAPANEPLRTVDTQPRFALCTPLLIQTGYGEREGQAPRALDVNEPLGTVVACGAKHAIAVPVIVPHYGGANGNPTAPRSVTSPVPSVTTRDHTSVATAFMVKWFGTAKSGTPVTAPMPTVLAGGGKGGGHAGLVHAFLVKYYSGKKGRPQTSNVSDPMPTVVTKERFGLVTINGENYEIVDVFLRMLKPSELKRAQGFVDSYDLEPARTKTKQIALIGNSVCQQVAQAIVKANACAPVGQYNLFTKAAT